MGRLRRFQFRNLEAEILINCTPAGMRPQEDQIPVPGGILREGMVVMDMVYQPPLWGEEEGERVTKLEDKNDD